MKPGNCDLAELAVLYGLHKVTLVLTIARNFAMVDGAVTCIFFGSLRVEFGMLVMMHCMMKTLERDDIQEIRKEQ